VQGGGEISPFLGKKISLQGIVSADRSGEVPAGFFLVDQNCPGERDGSLGIFVEITSSEGFIHLGDEVLIRGVVEEVGSETRIKSDLAELEIISIGNELPPETNLVERFLLSPDTFDYENLEGMLVSIPKGEFLKGFLDLDFPRILPLFDLDPALQMVCLQNQSITLQLSNPENIKIPSSLSQGDQVLNLVGILRQNPSGYVLELVGSSDFKVLSRQGSPDFGEGSLSAGVRLTGTQIFTLGTTSLTPVASLTSTEIPSATIIPSLTYYPVNLLISELYPNPTGKEPDGEWVEIYNPQSYAQSLTGIKLGDETSASGKEGMLKFPDGYRIGGNEVLVIAQQAKAFLDEFGFSPDFEMEDSDSRIPDLVPFASWGGSKVQFSNSGDEVILLDPWNGVVDKLVYGNSTAAGFSDPPPAPGEGHSLERYPPEMDRDRGGDWRERENPSPGRLDRSPATLSPSPTFKFTSTITPSLSPAPSPSATLKPSSTISPSPSPTPAVTASCTPEISTITVDPFTLTPTVEITPVLTPTLTITPVVTATLGASLTLTPSQIPSQSLTTTVGFTPTPSMSVFPMMSLTPSLTLPPTSTATDQPAATATKAVTVTPIPSITNSQQPTVTGTPVNLEDPVILLNEVHADPDPILGDANMDGQVHSDDDEFLEFVNWGDSDLDLSGWSISDHVKERYQFPEGTVLREGCGVVVFGGGDPQGDFGGSLIFKAGSLGLNNAGDSIFLKDGEGEIILNYGYGSEGGEDQSLTRWPDITGELPLVLHSEAEGANGDLFSPGTRVDGSEFGDCP
jgi:hypothetical protein